MASIRELSHTRKSLPGGGQIVVLNTGAAIGPEATAMLQALYSRSNKSIDDHLGILAERGPEKFMATYYVGYGHKSIGDCGDAVIFIEGVSMLVAKAVQDWPLYSGQESSTRFIDFANQPFVDPVSSKESRALLERWRAFYMRGYEALLPELRKRFPKSEEEKKTVYEKAISARAFDIMRGFLPAGAATNLAWKSNLRQIADKLLSLRHHPLKEVRDVAREIELAVNEAFPSSFDKEKRYAETERYNQSWMENYYLYEDASCPSFELSRDSIDRKQLEEYRAVLENRPPKTDLPIAVDECGSMQFRFLLDFGSFRDIQRHRAVTQRMPRVTTAHGFNDWYLEELPGHLRKEAEELLQTQENALSQLQVSPDTAQYYIAMGYNLPNRLTGSLRALVYLVELRATRFVHPTLRKRARQMAAALEQALGPCGLVLHLDTEPDRFDARRGSHDIVQKT